MTRNSESRLIYRIIAESRGRRDAIIADPLRIGRATSLVALPRGSAVRSAPFRDNALPSGWSTREVSRTPPEMRGIPFHSVNRARRL
jgi:hypothetical protein